MSYGCEFQSGPSSCRRWSTSSLISPRLRVEGVCRRVDDRHCKPSTYWLAIGSEFVTLVVTSELLLKQWIALLLWLASLRPRPGCGRLKASWRRLPTGSRAGARTGSGIPRTQQPRRGGPRRRGNGEDPRPQGHWGGGLGGRLPTQHEFSASAP